MLKKFIFLLSAAGFILSITSNAMALGIGPYFNVGGGGTTPTISTEALNKPPASDNFFIGGGLLIDTNLASSNVFNYRLKIGAQSLTMNRESEIKLVRATLDNIFGFGIVREKSIRWWIGPLVGAHYASGKGKEIFKLQMEKSDLGLWLIGFNALYNLDFMRDKIKKISYGGIGVGLATGININIGTNFSLGLEGGFKYDISNGSQNRSLKDLFYLPYNDLKDKLQLSTWNVYGEISFIYRVGTDTSS